MQKVSTPNFASLLDVKGGRRRHQEVLHEEVKERGMNETFISLFWIVYGKWGDSKSQTPRFEILPSPARETSKGKWGDSKSQTPRFEIGATM